MCMLFMQMTVICKVRHEQYLQNITGRINILQELGFAIHPIKARLTPKQKITFLGF